MMKDMETFPVKSGQRTRKASPLFWRENCLASGCLLLLFIFSAVLADHLAPYSPNYVNDDPAVDLADAFAPPSLLHPFGKDDLGRDVLSRVIWGTRLSLIVGIIVVSFSLVIGVIVGLITGYFRGWFDEIMMRLIDMLLAFPGILLAIAIIAILGPGLPQMIMALCLTGWVSYARLTRGLVLGEMAKLYVQAARSLGAGPARIVFRHVLPNILAPLIIKSTFGLAGVIMAEAALSFLGLGIQPPTPSWGTMLNFGVKYLVVPEAWPMTVFPGLAIMLLIMAINLLGEALRDWLDPFK